MAVTKVVILNWNGAHHLKRFLPSVVSNTPAGTAIVVADNGSTDESTALLQRDFPTVDIVQLDRNYGFAEGYNRAVEQIEADYLILLNSDVETPAGWSEPLVEALERNPDAAAVAPKLLSVGEPSKFEYAGASGGFIDRLGYPFCRGRILGCTETDEGQYDDPREVFWATGAAFCCRASAFREAGGFDADFFAHMEEIDLCWRLRIAGWRILVEPRSRVYHLGGGTLPVMSPAKLYYNHRNNLMMLFKCAPAGQRMAVALLRPLLDFAAAMSYLVRGNGAGFRAVVRAWADFLKAHPRLAGKRRAVQSSRNTHACAQAAADGSHGDKKFTAAQIYRGSILLRYMFGLRRFGDL